MMFYVWYNQHYTFMFTTVLHSSARLKNGVSNHRDWIYWYTQDNIFAAKLAKQPY